MRHPHSVAMENCVVRQRQSYKSLLQHRYLLSFVSVSVQVSRRGLGPERGCEVEPALEIPSELEKVHQSELQRSEED